MAAFTHYAWPGNVRELENVIERAIVLGSGVTIGLDDLPERLTRRPASSARPGDGCRLIDVERDHIRRTLETVGGNKAAAARALDVNRKTVRLWRKRFSRAARSICRYWTRASRRCARSCC